MLFMVGQSTGGNFIDFAPGCLCDELMYQSYSTEVFHQKTHRSVYVINLITFNFEFCLNDRAFVVVQF